MGSEQWKNDVAYAMNPFKFITWPIGVWPLQVYNVFSLIRFVCSLCVAILLVTLPTMEIYMGCTDAEQNVDSLMLICSGILGIQKTIWFRIYRNNLVDTYNSAIKDYMTIEDAKERSIMRGHTFIARLLGCCLVCFAYISSVIFGLTPLFGDNQNKQINITSDNTVLEYPMPSRCALEVLKMPTSMYRIFYLVEIMMLLITSTCNHGNDSMFINIMLHICGQVEILKTHFVNLDFAKPKLKDRFNVLIERHCQLIKLAKKLAETISYILLAQILLSCVTICIVGFQFILALNVGNVAMMGKSMMVQITLLLQLSLYSFTGDYLKSQMEEIGLSIYQSTWYQFPLQLMKNLVFIILQREMPVMLRAGNFMVVNLSSYMTILKTSASYLSVLRVMVDN